MAHPNHKNSPGDQPESATEDRFRALVNAISDVVYSVSADWAIMHKLDGRGFLKNVDVPTTSWRTDNIFPEDLDQVNAAIADAIAGKKMFQQEHRVLRVDSSVGWTLSRAVPILNTEGEITEWFGVASDITELKLAEEALRKSRDSSDQQRRVYETITSATPDLMYVFDLEYRFTYANKALLTMWGKTWETAIGNNLLENGYEPWHAEMHEKEIDLIVKTKQSVRGEVSFPHAILGKRIYDYILIPVLNDQGEVEAVAGTTRDVTDRKQWEESISRGSEELRAINEAQAASNEELAAMNEELAKVNDELLDARQKVEESQTALRLAISAADFGTWYIHSATREFITDARLKELFGYYPDEPLSIEQAVAQITDDYREYVSNKLENAIYNRGDYDVTYSVIGLHDNRLRWLRAIGNLKIDTSGAFSAFTGVVMDVTEQKQDEVRKNDFIGMVSHELKTPLTSLKAIIQVADAKLKNSGDQFLAGAMGKADGQVKRMSTLINGFLNISRLESGKILIEKTDFNMVDLAKEMINEMRLTTTSHHIALQDRSNAVMVHADRDKIESVLSNLLGNAVKYSPGNTKIELAFTVTEDEVITEVKDQGIGINSRDAVNIFGRYYRVEHTRTISGFGIGLYLSAEIVQRHGGRIWVESEPGVGSIFYFSLPKEC